MFKRQDPYTYTQFMTLYNNGSGTAQPIGVLAVEYRVAVYDDVQVQNQASVNLPQNQQFFLHCTQRVFLTNTGNSSVAPITGSTLATEYFANYPALIETFMQVANSSRRDPQSDGLCAPYRQHGRADNRQFRETPPAKPRP